MNEIVHKFLLAGDTFMPEMHLKQSGFRRNRRFKETGDISYIYKNKLDKVCFQHDKAFGDFKGLKRRTASDNILRDKAFNITKDPKYDGYQRGLATMVYKFSDKKSTGGGVNIPLGFAAQLAK